MARRVSARVTESARRLIIILDVFFEGEISCLRTTQAASALPAGRPRSCAVTAIKGPPGWPSAATLAPGRRARGEGGLAGAGARHRRRAARWRAPAGAVRGGAWWRPACLPRLATSSLHAPPLFAIRYCAKERPAPPGVLTRAHVRPRAAPRSLPSGFSGALPATARPLARAARAPRSPPGSRHGDERGLRGRHSRGERGGRAARRGARR